MSATAIVRILRPIALVGTAALFATFAPAYANLFWPLRFGLAAVAMVIALPAGVWMRLVCRTNKTALGVRCFRDGTRRRELVSLASHEMKTPLAGIKAYVELLTDGEADDEPTRTEFLQGIGSQVERLERAVNLLLTTTHDDSLATK